METVGTASLDFKNNPILVKLVMLGKMGVGKSAMTVRFLTKKYIGEYDPYIGSVYDHQMNIDGRSVSVEILDPGGKDFKEQNEAYTLWGDAFVLVYAINDQSSFDDLAQIRLNLEEIRGGNPARITVVGNKKDTEKERQVLSSEGERFARGIGCSFHEVSTAACYGDIERVFRKIIRETALDLEAREAMSCARRDSHIKIKEIVARYTVRQRAMSSLKETVDEYCATKAQDLGPDSTRERSNTWTI